MIDLNEVRVFTKVVESGSFSGAARTLGYPRATVSRKVSQLEESLGIRLLQRSTRKLNLTGPGREYYLKCSSALSEIEHANQKLTEAQQVPSGILRISAPLGAQSGFLADWINEFLKLHKDVSIIINLSDTVVDLIEGGIDVAFRAGQLKDSSLVARKLGDTKLVLCASPNYLANATELNSPDDLKKHAAIIFGDSQETAVWQLQSLQGNKAVHVHGRVAANSIEFALQSCLAGLGIGLLPVALVSELVKSNKLQIVLEEYLSDVGGPYIIYPSKTHLSVTVRAFVDHVIDKANSGIPWDLRI